MKQEFFLIDHIIFRRIVELGKLYFNCEYINLCAQSSYLNGNVQVFFAKPK